VNGEAPVVLSARPVTHGWIRPVRHPDLDVEVNGQSVVRYLRFGRAVRVDRLELAPLVAGRWVPAVPTHPAHVTVAVPDTATGTWHTIRDVELPPDPRIAGAGLRQDMGIEEMETALARGLETIHRIDVGGVTTDVLRVECDREHPVWPNHGECNGVPFSVPFGALDSLKAFGAFTDGPHQSPGYLPPLAPGDLRPRAPAGMEIEILPWMVAFRGPALNVGFSLRRPELLLLGWDGTGSGRASLNRLHANVGPDLLGGQSGPILRTFRGDFGPHCWTGTVDVEGSTVAYRGLDCGQGVRIDAAFTVEPDAVSLELALDAERPVPVLELEAWRLAWNCGAAMTGAAAVPTLLPGRNGDVELPMFWAGDGNGGLRCERLSGEARLQVESFRSRNAVVGGIVPGPRPTTDALAVPRPGTHRSSWRWMVAAFAPDFGASAAALPPTLRRHWGSIFSCFRPEYGGFSNNAVSVNCHVNQHCAAELAAFTRRPERGPDPVAMLRFSLERALLGGGGYGFWRNLYLDSDPVLVSSAGRLHQAHPDARWLERVLPGLRAAADRMLATLGDDGLAVCRDLSGNAGSHRWSSNAMDVVGFGHLDAYVNAWTYRALRNAEALLRASRAAGCAGCVSLAGRCRDAAERLREEYPRHLLNPATGWVAGWRSRDGELHDAAYLWLNGVACAFGLLPQSRTAEALSRLERLRVEVGAGDAHFGLPFNLRPIPAADHMLPLLYGGFTPTFEHYTDGAMSMGFAMYYLRALDGNGLAVEADRIAADLEAGYERGHFDGGVGSGVEMYRWDGVPNGYEGTFIGAWSPLYALAVRRGVIRAPEPEWWPAS
jgi:hypothetical protein